MPWVWAKTTRPCTCCGCAPRRASPSATMPAGPWASNKPVSKRDFKRATRLEIFRKQGLNITHVTQTISAVAASDELAEQLETDNGSPLISLVRQSYDMHNGKERLMDYLQVYYHPDRFQYRMDLEIEDAG